MRNDPVGDMNRAASCPFSRTTELVRDRWTLAILRESSAARDLTVTHLLQIPLLTEDLARERLRALTAAGLLEVAGAKNDGRGEASYRLSEAGMRLVIILRSLGKWAAEFSETER